MSIWETRVNHHRLRMSPARGFRRRGVAASPDPASNRCSTGERVHRPSQRVSCDLQTIQVCESGAPNRSPERLGFVPATTGPRHTGNLLRILFSCLVIFYCVVFASALRARDGNFFGGTRLAIGPDFAVFYAAGSIVERGNGQDIYDAIRQEAEQTRALGGTRQAYGHFYNPPWVAAPYAILATLPYLPAFFLAMLAMTALLIPTIWLLCGVSETVRRDPIVIGLALLAFWPLFWSLTDGQNTMLSLMCLAGACRALQRRREALAGIWLGCLLSKPQLVFLVLLLLAWQRRWRLIGFAAAVGVGLGLVGIALAGLAWPVHYLAYVTGPTYHTEVAAWGGYQMSLPGVVAYLLGAGSSRTGALTILLGLAGIAVAGYFWRRGTDRGVAFSLQFGFAVAATLAFAPHALYYDAALLLLPVLAVVDHWRASSRPGQEIFTRRRRLFLAGLFVAGFTWQFSAVTWVQPLAMLPILVGACVARLLTQGLAANASGLSEPGDTALPLAHRPRPTPSAVRIG